MTGATTEAKARTAPAQPRRRWPGRASEAYLDHIRRRECMFGCTTAAGSRCHGRTEPHHFPAKGMGGANGDDRRTVPVCTAHHREWHQTGAVAPFGHDATEALFLREQLAQLLAYMDQR